jgi:hypothetical protein
MIGISIISINHIFRKVGKISRRIDEIRHFLCAWFPETLNEH